MILDIRRAEYDEKLGKWILEYNVQADSGQRYPQRVTFTHEQAMLTYKKQLKDYIAVMQSKTL